MTDYELRRHLRAFLRYEPETGKIYWTVNSGGRAIAGFEAGCLDKETGYLTIRVRGKKYYAHRVAFLLHYGYLPEMVDHIEGLSNGISNLRGATHSENCRNQRVQPKNTSGFKGVCLDRERGKWIAQGGRNFLGRHATKEEAAKAYDEWALKEYGEFAKTNKQLGLL